MHPLADLAALEEVLQELLNRTPPLVILLPRQPGRKEPRYAHLFAGEPALSAGVPAPPEGIPNVAAENERIGKLEEEVATLREEVVELRRLVAEFKAQFE